MFVKGREEVNGTGQSEVVMYLTIVLSPDPSQPAGRAFQVLLWGSCVQSSLDLAPAQSRLASRIRLYNEFRRTAQILLNTRIILNTSS